MAALLHSTDRGLYCAAGDFYIDPWQPVERAVITHAHGDHARPGCGAYLTTDRGAPLLRERLGPDAKIETVPYGRTVHFNSVEVSLHPAGHILGSAQIRIATSGEVWVASGDYKTHPDATCEPFEPFRCHTFLTESTYGLPIYRWRPPEEIFAEIQQWWAANQAIGRSSVLFAYSLGKAQRILAGIDASIGPIFVHGAVARYLAAYAAAGVQLPPVEHAEGATRGCGLVLAPPSARGTPWLRRFGESSTAFVSGWMQIRGARRRRAVDRGFVLSDHADWPALLDTIRATGAENVLATHGYTGPLTRWLQERGANARAVTTSFEGDAED